MRIIAGQHRGTKLAQLVGADTRPTADRVRESLFNILEGGRFGQILTDAIVIDAFAGTGALGLEALSRRAKSARFIERDMKALSVLRANIDRLKCPGDCKVVAGDATSITAWQGPPATLMFADAPYGSGDGLLPRRASPVWAIRIRRACNRRDRQIRTAAGGGCRGIRHDRSGEPPLRPREPAFSGIFRLTARQRLPNSFSTSASESPIHVGRPWLHCPELGVTSISRRRAFISASFRRRPARTEP